MNDEEIRKALDDIAELKKSVRGPLKIMRPILLDKAFISFSYFGAVFIAGVFIVLYFVIKAYGSFQGIPLYIKILLAAGLIALLVPFTVIKTRIIKHNLARQKRSLSIWNLLTIPEFRNFYLVLLYGVALFTITFGYMCVLTGDWWLFIPASALSFSFAMALFALIFQVNEYYWLSALCAVFGLASLFFMKGDQLLWLAAFGAVFSGGFGAVLQAAKGSYE